MYINCPKKGFYQVFNFIDIYIYMNQVVINRKQLTLGSNIFIQYKIFIINTFRSVFNYKL